MALTEAHEKEKQKHVKYWTDRETEAKKHYITDEKEYEKELHRIYEDMLDNVQKEIDAFYGKYAKQNNITLAEAKKAVSTLDIKAYERKAKRYVKDKDFSKEANEEMRLYNLTMKVNRLEMLKANIGLELIAGHDELQKFMEGILKGRTMEELERQAGILGKTIKNNAQLANAIVNASFNNATFSNRIWQYQDLMKHDLAKMLRSGLIAGKNPRVLAKEIRKYFIGEPELKNGKKGADYNAERLMRTELARVQTEAQKQSFERNGFEMYTFLALGDACPICKDIHGKHFKIKDMVIALNAAPMHPNCRCSMAAYEDDKEYNNWLDYLESGGTTAEWDKMTKKEKNAFAKSKKVASKATKKKKESATIVAKEGDLKASDFPKSFTQKAEAKITQKIVDFVNGIEGASPLVKKLFSKMGKMESIESQGIPFKITHGKGHAVSTAQYMATGNLANAGICIPKLTGDNIAGQANTYLHESMHLMDLYLRKYKKKGGDWFCESRPELVKAFNGTSSDMSDEIKALFVDYKSEYTKTSEAIRKKYDDQRAALRESYDLDGPNWFTNYRQYEKEAKKLQTKLQDELDYENRNLMGGGVGNLQDIYDALSSGKYRDSGVVLYGHGSKYYRSGNSKIRETIANYGSLCITRPDLIEMLKRDKPELCAELEATIEAMIKEAGE